MCHYSMGTQMRTCKVGLPVNPERIFPCQFGTLLVSFLYFCFLDSPEFWQTASICLNSPCPLDNQSHDAYFNPWQRLSDYHTKEPTTVVGSLTILISQQPTVMFLGHLNINTTMPELSLQSVWSAAPLHTQHAIAKWQDAMWFFSQSG